MVTKKADKGLSVKNEKSEEDLKDMGLISEEDWKLREHRQQQRIQDVKVCLGFISESIEDYQKLVEKQSKEEHWNRYMSCDKLPRVQYPPEIRSMLSEIRHFEAYDVHSVINWELSVNERSLLSQDIFRKDLTRKTLERDFRPNIGQLYDIFVQRILTTLDRIERFLESEYEMIDVPQDRAIEIDSIRAELNQEIDELFDKLTYRIVCAPSSFKTSYDGVIESYCYKSPNYNLQIWWLGDVNIRFKHLELPLILANLDCVSVLVQVPFSVLCDNLTLRCVHTFFDHYSESAKSYEQLIDRSSRVFNGGMMDIEDCLINEWFMQVRIMDDMIAKYEQKLIEYAEIMREVEVAQPVKGEQNDKKTKKSARIPKLKAPKEPVQLPDGMYPDPYKAFLEQEQQELDDYLDEYLNPDNMQLKPFEVNLRRFCMLGGLYSMIFVRKPKHTDFQKFNITLHEDGRILYTLEDVRAGHGDEREESYYGTRSGSASAWSTRHRSRLQLSQALEDGHNLNLHLKDDELPFFCVSFQLSEQLCRFGEPLACQFIEEEVEEDEPEQIITVELEEHRPKKHKKHSKSHPTPDATNEKANSKSNLKAKKLSKQFSEHGTNLPRPPHTSIRAKSQIPRDIYRPSALSMLRLSSIQTTILPEVALRNFDVTGRPLSSLHNHQLQKHCMPRMLSSFKFPMEFKKEKSDELAEKEQRGCILMRRHHAELKVEEVDDDEPEYFTYEKQEAPERVYPVFDFHDKVFYELDSSSDWSTATADSNQLKVKMAKFDKFETNKNLSAYGVLQTLEEIHDQYKQRSKRLLEQPNFNIKSVSQKRSQHALEPSESAHVRGKSAVRISTLGSKFMPTPRSARSSHIRTIDTQRRFSDMEGRSSDTGSIYSDRIHLTKLSNDDNVEESRVERPKVKHWTTKYIRRTEFDPATFTFKIQTDRMGIFGFAYKRYVHFPFRDWSLQYNEDNINEIIFTLDTHHVRIILFITNKGIRGYVTKVTSEYMARPVKYLEIEQPISDYRELRRRFCEKNINIFAEHDACYYIENGYFSQKHLAAELHIYDAFAVHCKLVRFYRSDWNRLATRRNIILCLRNPKDINDGADVTIRVTPDNSTFVEVSEPCSDNLESIKLAYQLTWRNIGVYSDLHQLINSMNPQATDVRNRDPKLIYYIRTLLTEVRPLSFS